MLVNGQRPFSRKITNFMRAAQRLRGDSSRRRAFFALGVALLRGIRCNGRAEIADEPPSRGDRGGRRCEPPVSRRAVGMVWEKTGRLFRENAGEWAKCPRLFSKSPRWRSGGSPRSVVPSPLCAKRWEPGVRKLEARPPVRPFRRLHCGEIAVLRCGESESSLVQFDAKA